MIVTKKTDSLKIRFDANRKNKTEKINKTKKKIHTQAEKAEQEIKEIKDKLTRKTTIKARINRLSIINSAIAAILVSAAMLIIMHSFIVKNANEEVSMYAVSYSSVISNADLAGNKDFMAELFKDFDSENGYSGFGLALSSTGNILSETSVDMLKKGDNINTLTDNDPSYMPLAVIVQDLDNTRGTKLVSLFGERYLIGWAPVEKYDGCYTMIFLSYDEIISSFYTAVLIAALLAAFCLSVMTVISTAIAKKISLPISQACERLKKLAEGDLTSPAPTTTRNDETYILLSSLSNTIDSMRTYIDDIRKVLSEVSGGNLLVKSGNSYSGDFIEIKEALDKILAALNGTFADVNRAATQVRDCSGQVADGATTLSQSASVEASTMEELTASVADVSEKIRANAEMAENARIMTRSADEYVIRGNDSMNEMVAAIKDIETASAQISKIIKVIDDIAFQTNILALNAAVEAARAGAAGKGFAVVADEVRNLATKSAEAAAQTGKLINNASDSVKKGTELASETAEALNKIVEMVSGVTDIMDKIAVSANEQATAVSQINTGMEMINSSIQTTSTTAEESAAASEELSGQSDFLNEMINKFHFEG
ncbi:MAG: methyl-accepting chemotaxis protein [Huintestinicola sp.]